jgi:hypothetical protein
MDADEAVASLKKARNLASYRDLKNTCSDIDAVCEFIASLHSYAAHLQWCSSCAVDSVGSCLEGVELQAAAGMAPKESHDPL